MAIHSSILAWRQRSLVGHSPRGCKKLDTTERLTHTHTRTHTHDIFLASLVAQTVMNLSAMQGTWV